MGNGIHHTRMHYNPSLWDPVVSIALYRKMQCFGATFKFDPHFSRLTILVAFSMKMSRACSGILSSENDDFKFLKAAKKIKCTCITGTIVPEVV